MSRRFLIGVPTFLFVVGMMSGSLAAENQTPGANARLAQLFSDYWETQLRNYPTRATYRGDHRYDHLLTDYSETAYAARLSDAQSFLGRVQAVSPQDLSSADSLNRALFERMLEDWIEGAAFRDHLMPITQQGGPPSGFAELPTYHPMRSAEDVESYIARLQAFPTLVAQMIANMRAGMSAGVVPARVTMAKVLPQLEALMVRDPAQSILALPAAKLPENLGEADRTRLQEDIRVAVRDLVIPSYRKLHQFIRDHYLRACRSEDGIWSLPDGEERYAYAVRHYTTTSLTPEEIAAVGRRELARIHGSMRQIMRKLGFRGELQDYMNALRLNPRYYYTTADSLMDGFRAILKRMDAALPQLFGRLPKKGYDLKEIEPFRAPSAPAAYYYPAPDDGSRPGYFYVNTYKPETRPKYTMEALAYHEAVPGHHLQITIQQELEHLPDFRRHGGYTAFVEGWGLYSEQLPKEVNLYADPYSEFGRLTFDAWRAVRLIVDTGIHAFKWTREEAILFMKENTALSEIDIESEVERYIAWPGQALAYKIGQLKISELRLKAKQKLRDGFDIRRFHDALLADGALPLDLLERKMERWFIEESRELRRAASGRKK